MLEPTTPTPEAPRRRRRALVAGVSVLAAATAAVAVTAGGGGTDNRLSLVSGGTVADAESARSAAPAGEPAPMANGDAGDAVMSSDAKMSIAPWYQTTYEIDGDLAELGGEGRAWRFVAPDFDGQDAARMAAAFGLSGTPTERDGGWVLETADGHFSAYPSTDSWSINFNRTQAPAAGDSISAADAEAAAQALLDDLGVLEGRWDTEAMATEVGAAYGCAMPAMPADAAASDADLSPEELKARETGVARGEPGIDPNLCPPAKPAVAAQHVAFYPVLDGLRPDWSAWGVTVAAGGEIHSVYGTWTELREAGSYKLRSVDAALDELRNPAPVVDYGTRPMPAIASDGVATSSVAPDAPVSGAATPGVTGGGTSGAEPAVDMPAVMPVPDYCGPAADCAPPAPIEQKVTITGVSRSLTLTSVWTDGTVQTHLVPAYRFTGKWSTPEMGDRWETTVIALHPDAIAPPPPVGNVVPDAETKIRSEG